MPTPISIFPNIKTVTNGTDIDLDLFLDNIQNGKWQEETLAVFNKTREKSTLPYVTISGTFAHRSINGLQKHSGFLCMDVDDIDVNEVKSRVCTDKYVYACFTSVSGTGLAIIFRINPDKHAEAFDGLQEYLFKNYDVVCDPSCKDVSRPRYVSFDPYLFSQPDAAKFTEYPKKRAIQKIPNTIFAQDDFETLIGEIQKRGLNICEAYSDWIRVAFSLCDKFGEQGRSYFHIISANSSKYSPEICDRQYTNCLKARGQKIATIGTFYYYCKQAGLQIYSQRTKTVVNAALSAKKGGRTKEQAIHVLTQFEGISPEQSEDLVEQVFESSIEGLPDQNPQEQLEQWLRQEFGSMRRNEITRYIECNGKPILQPDMNSIWATAVKIIDKVNYEKIERTINSNLIPAYNPIHEFFTKHENDPIPQDGEFSLIDRLLDSILSEDFEYTRYFGRKWLVSIVASAFGMHSSMMMILSGRIQNTGKTWFLRHLLPDELQHYFGDIASGIKELDLNILMTQKLLLLDDECGGKSKRDEIALKSMLSKQTFSLREPYGRNNVDLNRIAVLCGTTNEEALLSDTTGNRRIIPIPVYSIDHEQYNSVNKTALFMEVYRLWQSGFKWELSRADIDRLKTSTARFEKYSIEYELVCKYIKNPTIEWAEGGSRMTATEVKVILEAKSGIKNLNVHRIGSEMTTLKFRQKMVKKMPASTMRVYDAEPIIEGYQSMMQVPYVAQPKEQFEANEIPFS
jgi:predicted P-loop ATPase